MDVKGLGHIGLQKTSDERTVDVQQKIKSNSASDRDPNGQAEYDGNREQKEPLTEEEILEAFERLKAMPAIKDSSLTAVLEKRETRYFVVIKDPLGKVVRRFPAQELSLLPKETENSKGVLLNKAM